MIYAFADALEGCYVEKKPLHVVRPAQSQFKGFTSESFNKRSPVQLRREFARKNFVVRDKGFQPKAFTLQELSQYSPLHQRHVFHDYSLGEIGDNRHAVGTVVQIFNEHSRAEDGKILNLLDLPANDAVKPHPLFTEVEAFRNTRKDPIASGQDHPTRDTRFVLVATKDATHGLHHDSDGFCTYVRVETGIKLWIIAVPLEPSLRPLRYFGDLIHFIREWSQADPNRKRYRFEAVALCPGDTL